MYSATRSIGIWRTSSPLASCTTRPKPSWIICAIDGIQPFDRHVGLVVFLYNRTVLAMYGFDSNMGRWSCPVCHAGDYMRAMLSRGPHEYPSQFHFCLGCSAVFIEPQLFMSAPHVVDLFPPLSNPMSHELSLRRQAIERRFWEARAKRLRGMTTDAPDSMVVELMRRGRLDQK